MRSLLLLAICSLLTAGCGSRPASPSSPQPAATSPAGPATSNVPTGTGSETNLIVTPDAGLHGRVGMVNDDARYVILSYPIGSLPEVGQSLSVYRNGLKVGEVRVTGPRRDFNIAADITKGECAVGDLVQED